MIKALFKILNLEGWSVYGLAVIALILALLGDEASHYLRYERTALESHQYWRALTGHWVHASWTHTAFNLIGMVFLQQLYGEYYRVKNWLPLLLACSLVISACLYGLQVQMDWYYGLSGVLHSLFVIGALADITAKAPLSRAIFVGFWVKIAWEQWAGPSAQLALQIGTPVLIDAHLYGALCALVLCLLQAAWIKFFK